MDPISDQTYVDSELFDEFINWGPDDTLTDQTTYQHNPECQQFSETRSDGQPSNFVDRPTSSSSSGPSDREAHTTTGGHDLEFTTPAERSSNVDNVFYSTAPGNPTSQNQVQGQTSTPSEDSRSASGRQIWRPVAPRPSAQSTTSSSPSVANQHGGLVTSSRRRLRHPTSRTPMTNNYLTHPSGGLTCQTCRKKYRTSSELRYVNSSSRSFQ